MSQAYDGKAFAERAEPGTLTVTDYAGALLPVSDYQAHFGELGAMRRARHGSLLRTVTDYDSSSAVPLDAAEGSDYARRRCGLADSPCLRRTIESLSRSEASRDR